MAGFSSYAVRMARLSSRIFGEVVRPTDSKSMKVVQLFQEPPLAKRKEVYEWYPHHKVYYELETFTGTVLDIQLSIKNVSGKKPSGLFLTEVKNMDLLN
uniref:Small ribosomal subunit protein mS33 n=1 Tax=Poecilia mexicana TaxID=48701 RepID=A0A3B3XJ52_9TELE